MMAEASMDVETRLRVCGLRPTRQRIALADLLFAKGDRHLGDTIGPREVDVVRKFEAVILLGIRIERHAAECR